MTQVAEQPAIAPGGVSTEVPGLVPERAATGAAEEAHESAFVEERRAKRQFLTIGIAFGLFTALMIAWFSAKLGGLKVTDRVDDISEFSAAFAGGATCLVYSRRGAVHRVQVAWRFIGAGAISWGIGQVIWSYYDIVRNVAVPFPSLADAGFLLAVPLLLIGVLCFPASRQNSLARARFILDGLILGGSLLAVSWGTVLGATYHTSGQSTFAEVIGLAYPLGDVATVTVALSILAHTGRRYLPPLSIIIAGMLCLAISDSAFVYLTQTTTYSTGDVVDAGWIAGFLILGLASVRLVPVLDLPGDERSRSWWQIVLPYGMLGGASAFILGKYFERHRLDTFLAVDVVCLFVVVLVRQVVTLLEDTRLNRRLETAVTTLRRNESLLSYQAVHDPLTGLGNRVYFGERIEAALAREHEPERYLAVLLCDLDRFKDANDTLGHSVGDSILVSVAQRLLASVREGDSVARVGGDEFAVILDDVTGPDQASGIAIRIVDAMRLALEVASKDCFLNISVGIALRTFETVSVEEILREADVALYAAKDAGGDSHRLFESKMGDAHFERLKFQGELAIALENGELVVEYEPIIHLESQDLVGVEALLRWDHPTRGMLQPKDFLDLAERSGAIVPIGQWVLDHALGQLRQWRESLGVSPNFWMAVNVSPSQLVSGEFMTAVVDALEAHELDPSLLRLELTENALVEQGDSSVELLSSLKTLGVHITIDDFGTGYSSLAYLRTMPLDTLKVDRSFICELEADTYESLIVDSVVKLAHARGIDVVGEGVETLGQLELLRKLSCDYGQGFYWSRSRRAESFARWVSERQSSTDGTNHADTNATLPKGDH